jgi:hypothetical protein
MRLKQARAGCRRRRCSAGNIAPEDREVLDEFHGMCRDYAELKRAVR